MAISQAEQIQALVLQTLDRDGTIPDSRELELNGAKLATGDDQTAIKAVLDSLLSKEVGHSCAAASTTSQAIQSKIWY